MSSAGHILAMINSLKANSRRRGPSYLKRGNATLLEQGLDEELLQGGFAPEKERLFFEKIHRARRRRRIWIGLCITLAMIGLVKFYLLVFT